MTNAHVDAGFVGWGPDPADAPLVAVAVHGRGHSPDYMVEQLIEPVGLDDVAWLLPVAAGGSWYPNGFLAPIPDNQPCLDHALAALAMVERRLEARDPSTVVWAGFSQGACLVSEHVARRPRRWGGLLCLTGGMAGPAGTALNVAGDLGGMPAYFSVHDADEWVPRWRVHETADAYRRAGAEVEVDVFPGSDHVITPTEIERARSLLVGRS